MRKHGDGYVIWLSTQETERLLEWMRLSAMCLQTWPKAADHLLQRGFEEGLF